MGVFKREEPSSEPVRPAVPKKASSPKKGKSKSTTRSTQLVARRSSSKVSGPASVFLSSPASSVAYSSPRSLTAAAVQIKINDKGEFEQFRQRRSAGSSAWQAEAWEY